MGVQNEIQSMYLKNGILYRKTKESKEDAKQRGGGREGGAKMRGAAKQNIEYVLKKGILFRKTK